MDDKFYRIRAEYNPVLFAAFFHNGSKMDGVTFEIGWLCCKYHSLGLSKKLRILAEVGYNWNQTTPYIQSLFAGVPKLDFDESKRYYKASQLIRQCVLQLV